MEIEQEQKNPMYSWNGNNDVIKMAITEQKKKRKKLDWN